MLFDADFFFMNILYNVHSTGYELWFSIQHNNIISVNFMQYVNFLCTYVRRTFPSVVEAKLYISSTLNIDLTLWHTQLIVCAVK